MICTKVFLIYAFIFFINYIYILVMNSRQIEIFHAVMKKGTVTEAAARLGISQPAVTTSLKQMEASLGFNLFHRAGGRLHPTAQAQVLLNEAVRIQDSLTVFKNLAERLKQDLTAHLRVATPPVFSHDLIPDTIATFSKENKNCLIDATTQHHDAILKDIANTAGTNNLGITFGVDDTPGLGSIHIGSSNIMALIPRDLALANKETIHPADFASQTMVGTFTGEPLGNAVEALLESSGVSANYIARVQNHSVAANLASKGVGTAIVDSITAAYALRYFNKKSFKVRPIEGTEALPVTAVYSYEHPLNKNAKRFIDIFRSCFRAQ